MATAALILAACSSPSEPPRQPAPVAPSSPAPASSPASAFCLNLPLLQVALVLYRADLSKMARGGLPLDLTELRRQSANVARIGEPMKDDAPADIRDELTAALKAVAASRSKLNDGLKPQEQWDLLLSPKIRPTFDAVNEYTCSK